MSKENPQFKWGQRDGMTLDEIAKHFGLTRERIRQIEAKALRKVRNRLRARGLTLRDFIQSFKD